MRKQTMGLVVMMCLAVMQWAGAAEPAPPSWTTLNDTEKVARHIWENVNKEGDLEKIDGAVIAERSGATWDPAFRHPKVTEHLHEMVRALKNNGANVKDAGKDWVPQAAAGIMTCTIIYIGPFGKSIKDFSVGVLDNGLPDYEVWPHGAVAAALAESVRKKGANNKEIAAFLLDLEKTRLGAGDELAKTEFGRIASLLLRLYQPNH